MVRPISNSQVGHPVHRAATETETPNPTQDVKTPGGRAIGLQAKQELARLTTVGPLPKNAQGIAASSLARGMSPEAFLNIAESPADNGAGDVVPGDEVVSNDDLVSDGDVVSDGEVSVVDEELPADPVANDAEGDGGDIASLVEDLSADVTEAAIDLLEPIGPEDGAETI